MPPRGAVSLILAYGFSLFFSTEVWHFVVANILIGFGIGFGYAAMPMLIMRAAPPSETGASNGLNALARSLGTSTAAAIVGVVLATLSTRNDDGRIPTAQAFQVSFLLGIGAAAIALVLALLIPAQENRSGRRASLPE
ncbi:MULTISPECIES: MFS transporter [Microbacterium]|uniref:MFS transporter n=1 Tax=Microbacterium TaxID=33882 RepID=UPI00277D791B|nr:MULTISPECIES: MFS transporter [Microbacterium]MDQ1075155.1 MFS family permease [Microbacterium sp. SORGH_AS_0969]MDQ1115386.1 MFS family permease [Microbacterium testaceum]